tara:strand:- start:1218 stop:1883 length:666 start_codon:yes stop_codon:yes gene_type:complete
MTGINWKYQSVHHAREDNIKEYIDSLPTGCAFYDLGANLGWFSLYAASKGLDVHAFEVDPQNFSGLTANVMANPDLQKNLKIYNQGIADNLREVALVVNSKMDFVGSHHKTLDIEEFAASTKIQGDVLRKSVIVDSMDNIVASKKLRPPEHMKVDIDGSEYLFLRGAPATLKSVKSMVIELWEMSEYYDRCCQILTDAGFIEAHRYEIPNEKELYNIVYRK